MKETKQWFETWFDTNEYHTLYGHRDSDEATEFVDNIIDKFALKPCSVLDAGCGAGRHVHAWSRKGFNAHGFDLSSNSINIARAKAQTLNLNSSFSVLDMRQLKNEDIHENQYDIVTNLFTSFGYFPDETDHTDVVEGFANALKVGGMLVLDYINAKYSEKRLVSSETQTRDGIHFEITRKFINGFFTKTISFRNPTPETHTELVKAWSAEELSKLLTSVGLHVNNIYGDYSFTDYTEDSPRMILIAEKK